MTTSTEIGYMSGGVCGYIAAGLVLLYEDIISSYDFVPDEYLNSNGTAYNGSDFTVLLRTFGESNDTVASDIKNVISDYCDTIDISVTSWTKTLPSTKNITDKIDADAPVILFGNLYLPDRDGYGNHAVTVYGYRIDNSKLIAHYGWSDYNNIFVSSLLPWGTAYSLIGYN